MIRLPLLKKVIKSLNHIKLRTFLTENYYCYNKWDKFLGSETMKSVGLVNTFSANLDEKFLNKTLVTPLDMDLLAAKIVFINNFQELEYIENLYLNFRKTQAALYVRDSMHYSLARSYIDLNQSDRYLKLLKQKYKYGFYLDSFTSNMLMDTYLKKNDYTRAALVAHEIMLQEMTDNKLTLAACLFSCYKHLIECKTNKIELSEEQQLEEQDDKPVKQLVYFLRKPYNDEHFDLNSMTRLSGKTIKFAISNLKLDNEILSKSLEIYGLLMFEKYEQAVNLFEQIILKDRTKLYRFLLDEFKSVNEKLTESNDKWTNLNKLLDEEESKKYFVENIDIGKELEAYLNKLVENETDKQIKLQEKFFYAWEIEQEIELKNQIKNFQIDAKKTQLLKRIDELEKQEEIFTFFDKQQKIINTYNEKGFPNENPADLPIEPEQSEFDVKFEKHFKPWPKYANRPEWSLKISEEKKEILESLNKIYLRNAKAQTIPDTKLIARR